MHSSDDVLGSPLGLGVLAIFALPTSGLGHRALKRSYQNLVDGKTLTFK